MLMGCGPPNIVQLFPSGDVYPVKLLPVRTSFIQYGGAAGTSDLVYDALPAVAGRFTL
jgi:hypothetical protein